MKPISGQNEKISVVIPCRNEEAFIGRVLDNVLEQDYPSELLEVFVVDGQSEDRTAEIIKEYVSRHGNIQLLNNPEKVVPFALNQAIRRSTGSIVVRMDAHSVYPGNYISALVSGLGEYRCDNTGGVWITEPADSSLKALAIADATSHPFGIGNAHYRLDLKSPRKVDTVPYGCYRKEIFERIGLFDEELVRNQDDEFNARLIKNGGTIYLLPDVKIRYFARSNFPKTARMFYQYGLYKPLVNLKIGRPATLRQFAPPLFTLYVLLFSLLGLWQNVIWLGLLPGLAFYALADLIFSIQISVRKLRPFALFLNLLAVFPVIHFSYGFGYLSGIVHFVILRKRIHHSSVRLNR